jgi:hypothetical protein
VSAIVSVLRELYGLFVEDAGFAGAILIWTAVFGVAAHYIDGAALGPVLFGGFAVILIVEVRRASSSRAESRDRHYR